MDVRPRDEQVWRIVNECEAVAAAPSMMPVWRIRAALLEAARQLEVMLTDLKGWEKTQLPKAGWQGPRGGANS